MYCEFYKYFVLDISVLIKGIKEKLLNEFSHQPKKRSTFNMCMWLRVCVCVCFSRIGLCSTRFFNGINCFSFSFVTFNKFNRKCLKPQKLTNSHSADVNENLVFLLISSALNIHQH